MEECIKAVLMGIVQGLSEFLPISSSGHLVFTSSLLKIFSNQELTHSVHEIFFDIILHLGTLLAVCIYLYSDIVDIVKKAFNKNYKPLIFVTVATIFTIFLALIIKPFAEKLMLAPEIVALLLIVTGFVLYFSEKIGNKNKEIDFKNSLFVGLAQGLAALPGLSRSGLTIATAMLFGVNRTDAAKFSFLLSVPIILGSSVIYPIKEIGLQSFVGFDFKPLIVGFITSFVVGYFCIKYFMQFLQKHSLIFFSFYCWIFGILMFIVFSLAN